MQKATRAAAWILIVTMISLLIGMPAWSSTEKIQLRQTGYELESPAYVVPPKDARDTMRLIAEQDAELKALREHVSKQGEDIKALSADISEIETAVGKEREAWSKKNSTLKKEVNRLRNPWALGFFAGYDAVHSEISVGLGLTYKLIGM